MGQIPRHAAAPVLAMVVVLIAAGLAFAAESPPPPPLATADTYAAIEDKVLVVPAPGVLANDNPGPTSCVVILATPPPNGTVELQPDGSFTYTPPANFNGETSFGYALKIDGDKQCSGPSSGDSEATVTITVASVNDPPTANADSFTAIAGRTLNVAAPGVLINDHDIDGDTLMAITVTGVKHGTLVLASSGAFSYTPAGGFLGSDGFSYRASDGTATSPTRAVTLSVVAIPTPVPTAPPTPIPTVAPSLEPSPEPTLAEPSPGETTVASLDASPSPEATLLPTASGSPPASTPAPGPAAGSGGGPSLPVLLVIVLLAVLLAFGAAIYVPRWLGTARGGEPPDDDA